MEQRVKKGARISSDSIPVVTELTPTSATISFTERSIQALMDEAYAAEIVEVAVRSRWQGQAPKREEEVEEQDEDGKPKRVKRFIYDFTQPTGHVLHSALRDDQRA
jgi:CRISPR-associated protein Cmx8